MRCGHLDGAPFGGFGSSRWTIAVWSTRSRFKKYEVIELEARKSARIPA